MFLITTADQRYWKTDEPVFFLGEWCKIYSKKALWQNMEYEVLAYHWDDRKKLLEDYKYLQELYERVLADMARCLNIIHVTDHSIRYWRIIIGPWLFCFIHIFYDRYICIEQAVKSGKVTDTIVGSYAPGAWIPRDNDHFNRWLGRDDYNFFLYSWIIARTKNLPFRVQSIEDDSFSQKGTDDHKMEDIGFSRKLFKVYEKYLPHRFNKYVMVGSFLKARDQWKVQLSLGQWPSIFPPLHNAVDVDIDAGLRSRIQLSVKKGNFEELLSGIIGQQIPVMYLEGYQKIKDQALRLYPSKPKVILTANDFYSNESFKIWCAEKVEKGARLAGVQHGGLYGSALFCAAEEHEKKISDVYYTWGWDVLGDPRVQPLPAAKLNSVRNLASARNGKIFLVTLVLPRYSYHLYSSPVAATGILSYFNDQYRFVSVLDEKARKNLIVRLFPQDSGWSQQKRWVERFPDLEFHDVDGKMLDKLKECSLFVGTYNATTYLETFVANFPTVLFWDFACWELRPEARPYFDELIKAGILHETPESAARKVNEISPDPMAWWQKKDVQQAKNNFCMRFANISDDWAQKWRQELLQLADRPLAR